MKMDITDELQKIWFLFADNRLLPVLEKMTVPVMP
jgi:hypothetical protein